MFKNSSAAGTVNVDPLADDQCTMTSQGFHIPVSYSQHYPGFKNQFYFSPMPGDRLTSQPLWVKSLSTLPPLWANKQTSSPVSPRSRHPSALIRGHPFARDRLPPGMPLRMTPNFEDLSCEFAFGQDALPASEDPLMQEVRERKTAVETPAETYDVCVSDRWHVFLTCVLLTSLF